MAIRQESISIGLGPFTFRDLERTPDDGQFYELSHGVLVVTPGPNLNHQLVASKLVAYLESNRQPTQAVLMEAELLLSDDTVKRPDVMVVDKGLVHGQHIKGIPALVVEVASPSTSRLDRTEKRLVYAEAGIPGYWLVDPDARTITVLELVDGDYVERASLDATGTCEVTTPGRFVLDAGAIFGD
jgi:Uma2 family endonuclease